MQAPRYRSNVAAILQRNTGEILSGKRSDQVSCWQFPQGGVKPGETLEGALQRELEEEISLRPKNVVIGKRKGPYRYLFDPERKKEGFDGQEQFYFLVDLLPGTAQPNPATADPEFSELRWIEPASFQLDWLPPFKREVYRAVFADFFEIAL
jgi:putative (di)nucleoside polyphosphate hydrolase